MMATPERPAPPVEQLLSISRVSEFTTFSKATIYRKISDGSFPPPFKIGKSRVAWRQSDIAAWLAQQSRAA